MGWNGKDELKLSVQERGFTLEVEGRTVPGVYWCPAEADGDRLVGPVDGHDEIVPLQARLELFGKLGTTDKTLHVNPGTHTAIPPFEFADTVAYLDQRLT